MNKKYFFDSRVLPLSLSLSLLMLFGQTATAWGQNKTAGEWWKIGNEMPFHVVDFVHGKKTKGGGCPAVISKNTKSKAVEIWFRSDPKEAFEVAHLLGKSLKDKADIQKYVVAFDLTKEELSQKIKSSKMKFSRTQFCTPRKSVRRLMNSLDPKKEFEAYVFLIDQKVIKGYFPVRKVESGKELGAAKNVCSRIKASIEME